MQNRPRNPRGLSATVLLRGIIRTLEYIKSISVNRISSSKFRVHVTVWIDNPTHCVAGQSCDWYDDWPENLHLWIDWNANQSFSSSELVINKELSGSAINASNTMFYSKDITIPTSGVTNGTTYLRANISKDNEEDPCTDAIMFGDVFDKKIAPKAPYIESLSKAGRSTTGKEPTTGSIVDLTSKNIIPSGYTITKCSWSGDITAGTGDIANNCKYSYTPSKGAGPAVKTYGNKKAQLTISWKHTASGLTGASSTSFSYKVFFKKSGDDDGDKTPNWAEYWRMTDDKAVPGFDNNVYYDSTTTSYGTADGASDTIHIGKDAAETHYSNSLTVPRVEIGTPPNTIVVCTGGTFGGAKGINALAEVIKHEDTHIWVYKQWQAGGSWAGKTDSDEGVCTGCDDDLPDDYETNTNHTSNTSTDSCDLYSHKSTTAGYDRYGDQEWLCLIQANGRVGTIKNDWANPGKQTSTPFASETIPTPSQSGPIYHSEITTSSAPYHTNEAGLQFGTLWGYYEDSTSDADADGLYDSLNISTYVWIKEKSVFNLVVWLEEMGPYTVAWGSTQVELDPGETWLTVKFDGKLLRDYGYDGSYQIARVELRATEDDILSDYAEYPHVTAYYAHDSFEPPAMQIDPSSFITYPNDIDADGLYESLATHFDLDLFETGTYTFTGELVAADLVANASNVVTYGAAALQPAGFATTYLEWPVDQIFQSKQDGPYYMVNLSATNENGEEVEFMSYAHTTDAYTYNQFDHGTTTIDPAATTSSQVDVNGDGLIDYLDVQVSVTTDQPRTVTVSASLTDSEGNPIEVTETTTDLVAGANPVVLRFSGATLGQNGVDGPFLLTGLNVTDEEGTVLDAQPGGYTTPAIPVSELAPALLSLDGAYTEEAPDGDGDGLYDELRIKVLVDVAQPGYVTAIARLVDAHGREIAWAEGSAYAAGGPEDGVVLVFPSLLIAASLADGPYSLRDLTVTPSLDAAQSIYLEDAYTTTGTYHASDFGNLIYLPMTMQP